MQTMSSKIWKSIENMLYLLLKKFFTIFHKEMTMEIFGAIMQFLRFGIVGVSNTLVSYVIYVVSLLGFHKINLFPHSDYLVAQLIAFVLSVLWSFYWNNKMVFMKKEGQSRSIWKTLFKTYVAYSFTGLFLNSILIILWVQVIHISEFIAPIINLLVSVPLNFIINKFWAFK